MVEGLELGSCRPSLVGSVASAVFMTRQGRHAEAEEKAYWMTRKHVFLHEARNA